MQSPCARVNFFVGLIGVWHVNVVGQRCALSETVLDKRDAGVVQTMSSSGYVVYVGDVQRLSSTWCVVYVAGLQTISSSRCVMYFAGVRSMSSSNVLHFHGCVQHVVRARCCDTLQAADLMVVGDTQSISSS